MECKLCGNKIYIACTKKENKDRLLKFKICLDCYNAINDDYRRSSKYEHLNPYPKCICCGNASRKYGQRPVCESSSCRGLFHRFRGRRSQIIHQLNNGGLEKSNVKIYELIRLGFKVKITPLPESDTFIKGVIVNAPTLQHEKKT